jgi:YD repeat-containing protein
VQLSYDDLTRLVKMVDASGTNQFAYYAGGLLKTEGGLWASDTVTNFYSSRLRTSLVLQQPTGTWTNQFTYDAARRLTNLVSKAGSFSYEYSAGVGALGPVSAQLVKRLTLPNSAAITNDFDSVGRVTKTHLRTSSAVLTNKHEYAYNLAGQRTRQTRVDASTVDYTYDKIGQLKTAAGSGGQSTESLGYAYDAAWNLHYRTNGATTTFSVNGLNELTNISTGVSLAWDRNGNLTNQSTVVYEYDDENQLVSVYDSNPASNVE